MHIVRCGPRGIAAAGPQRVRSNDYRYRLAMASQSYLLASGYPVENFRQGRTSCAYRHGQSHDTYRTEVYVDVQPARPNLS